MGKAPRKHGKLKWGGKEPRDIHKFYLSRTQVLNRLQINHKEFRRLCILKGIYPVLGDKVPGLKKGNVYYLIKDVRLLQHEPLLEKMRAFQVFLKKYKKALDKNEPYHAKSLKEFVRPHVTLDHLLKERYPTFQSALEDLDDCLTLLFMFSKLPANELIPGKVIQRCGQLVKEFLTYVAHSHTLRKVFISVKGFYFQAEIMGVKVTWIAPYDFTHQGQMNERGKDKDHELLDYHVFKTFLSFYDTLMSFVNFKLFHLLGQSYPPSSTVKGNNTTGNKPVKQKKFSFSYEAESLEYDGMYGGSYLLPLVKGTPGEIGDNKEGKKLTEKQKKIQKESEKRLNTLPLDKIREIEEHQKPDLGTVPNGAMAAVGQSIDENDEGEQKNDELKEEQEEEEEEEEEGVETLPINENAKEVKLFSGFRFYISRECPFGYLEFIIVSCYGTVTRDETDSGITHYILDRPTIPSNLLISNAVVEENQSQIVEKNRRRVDMEFVQPQWVFDCVNNQFLLPVHKYRPGEKLPPHLSPFIDTENYNYVPDYAKEIAILKAREQGIGDQQGVVSADLDEDEEMQLEEAEKMYGREMEAERSGKKFESLQLELEKEKKKELEESWKYSHEKKTRKQKQEEEETRLRATMMPKKKWKLYDMKKRQEKKKQEVAESLTKKKLRIMNSKLSEQMQQQNDVNKKKRKGMIEEVVKGVESQQKNLVPKDGDEIQRARKKHKVNKEQSLNNK